MMKAFDYLDSVRVIEIRIQIKPARRSICGIP